MQGIEGVILMGRIEAVIKEARDRSGMTQYQIADAVGVSRAYYADVERGRYTPSLKLLSRLAVLLNIDLNFLKENDGNTCI
jgi:transcriptional regulator with XRE-family HTH domain|nr:MAG TPA: Helix-turn-helix XRE-family like protein [Caudoviricetes sp.]